MTIRKLVLFTPFVLIGMLLACSTKKMVKDSSDSLAKLTQLWKEIDSLQDKQMDKSSLVLVKEATDMAARLEQSDYHLKGILTGIRLEQRLGDTGNLSMIGRLEAAINATKNAEERSLLESMLGQYYAVRSEEVGHIAQDIRGGGEQIEFLSKEELSAKADSLYQRSVANWHATELEQYDLVLVPDSYDVVSFSQVSDLLFWRAIQHHRKHLKGWYDRSIYEYGDESEVFSLLKKWLEGTASSATLKRTRVELQRLDLINDYFQGATNARHEEYLKGLDRLAKQYTSQESLDEISLKRANFLISARRENYPKARKQAHQLATDLLDHSVDDDMTTAARGIILLLEHESMSMEVESVLLPQQNFLARLNFTNLDQVKVRIVKTDFDPVSQRNHQQNQQEKWAQYSILTPVHEEIKPLPQYLDYHGHSTDWIGPKLSPGHYVIMLESESNKDLHAMQEVTVSNLAYQVHRGIDDHKVYIADRTTGKPRAALNCTLYRWNWHRDGRRLQKLSEHSTDIGGGIRVSTAESNQLLLHIQDGDDELWSDQIYFWRRGEQAAAQITAQFYTDRAIYRPGDSLQYSCLVSQSMQNRRSTVVAGHEIEILFIDANGEEIAKASAESDQHGMVTGKFHIPEDRLLGMMALRSRYGQQSIRVEAYKKPTFTIALNLKDSLPQLGEEVTVSGSVSSYIGFPIGKASVRYTVYRRPLWRYWGYSQRGIAQNDGEQLMAAGETMTAVDGTFTCSFNTAEVGRSHQTYQYELRAEVTDLQGETQEARQSFNIGSHPFLINIDLEEQIHPKSLARGISIRGINAVGDEVHLQDLTAKLYSISADRWHKDTYWQVPDTSSYQSKDYEVRLPEYAFPNQSKSPKSTLLRDIDVSNQKLIIPDIKAGQYRLEVMASNGSLQGSITRNFTVVEPQQEPIPTQDLFITYVDSLMQEVGAQVKVHLASPQSTLVYFQLEDRSGIVQQGNLEIDGWQELRMTVPETSQGGLILHLQAIYSNRSHHKRIAFEVPWQDIDVKLVDFNAPEKTSPGKTEEISFLIEGNKGQAIDAAYTLTLYDAALDQMAQHNWRHLFAPIFRPYFGVDLPLFGSVSAYPFDSRSPAGWRQAWVSPDLNWFGIRLHTYGGRQMYRRSMDAAQGGIVASAAKEETVEEEVAVTNQSLSVPEARTNFSDNLLWIGNGKTGMSGRAEIKIPINDELTKWKGLLFIHSQDLKTIYHEFEFESRKDLLIVPNVPRFVRVQDSVGLSAKVVNNSSIPQSIMATLQIANRQYEEQEVLIEAGQSEAVSWMVSLDSLPKEQLTFTMSVQGQTGGDAIKKVIPVLSRNVLVHEGKHLKVPKVNSSSWDLDDLFSFSKETSQPNLTLEVCSNPLWYALAALPNLTSEHPTSISLANELYSIKVAGHMDNLWPGAIGKIADAEGFNSLERNEDLSLRTLKATSWLNEAREVNQRAAAWRNLSTADQRTRRAKELMKKLMKNQLANGAWPWIEGGQPSIYITMQVLLRLAQIADLDFSSEEYEGIIADAVRYLDRTIDQRYKKAKEKRLNVLTAEYVYLRTQYQSLPFEGETKKTYRSYLDLGNQNWHSLPIYMQALIAKTYHVLGDSEKVKVWTKSLRERAIHTDDRGIYWKNEPGKDWREQPLQRHALLIDLFRKVQDSDPSFVAKLEEWMVAHRQVNQWEGSINTVAAIQSLLGVSARATRDVVVSINNQVFKVNPDYPFFSKTLDSKDIAGELKLSINNENTSPIYGFAHLRYRAPAQSLTGNQGGLMVTKKMYRVVTQGDRETYVEVGLDPLSVGDRILTRLSIEVDRPMEFIHLEDKRSAVQEPVEVNSGYRYDGRISHYRTSDEHSTHFFLEQMSKGRHVLEYESWVTHTGVVSGGLAQIQHAFAPGFSGHSSGTTLTIK